MTDSALYGQFLSGSLTVNFHAQVSAQVLLIGKG